MSADSVSGKPDPSGAATPAEFVDRLNALRGWAGQPSYRALRDLAGARPGSGIPPVEALPTSTTHEILAGKRLPRLPRLDFVESFVTACLRAGSFPADGIDAEVERWRQSWRGLARTAVAAVGPAERNGRDSAPTRGDVRSNGYGNGSADQRTSLGPRSEDGRLPGGLDGRNAPTGQLRPPVDPPAAATGRRMRPGRRHVVAAVALFAVGSAVGLASGRYLRADPLDAGDVAATPARPSAPIEMISPGTFDEPSQKWWNTRVSMAVEDGRLRVDVSGRTARPWDEMVGCSGLHLREGRTYSLTFEAAGSVYRPLKVRFQEEFAPYKLVYEDTVSLTTTQQRFALAFHAPFSTDVGQLTFQFGGHDKPYTAYIDNVSLIQHPW